MLGYIFILYDFEQSLVILFFKKLKNIYKAIRFILYDF